MKSNCVTNTLNNLFGFMLVDPIHVTLKKMHTVQILALLVTYNWADALMVKILLLSGDDVDPTLLGIYFTNFAVLVTVFWKAVNEIRLHKVEN